MKQQPQNQALGASETTRFFCTQISPAAGAAGELKQHKKEPDMAKRNTNPGGGKTADSGVCGYIVLRVLPIARRDVWDECDALDNGFLKLALRASRRI